MRARVDKDGSSFKMSLKATIILAVVVAVIFMFAGGWIRGAITKFFNPQQELTNEVVVKQLEKIQDLTTAKETDYGFEKYEDGGIAFLNKKQFTMFYTYEVRAGVDLAKAQSEFALMAAQIAAVFGFESVGLDDHGHRVPAHVGAQTVFNRDIAGTARLL